MQSSYNLIKVDKALEGNGKVIQTTYIKNAGRRDSSDEESLSPAEIVAQYKEIANNIIEDAQNSRKKMLIDIVEQSKQIEKEAYENGYNQGFNNGVEDAKREVEENIIPNAKREADNIRLKAQEILAGATTQYNEYLDDKKEEIIKLAFKIAEEVLKKKIEVDSEISSIVENAIKDSKGEKHLLIRANVEDIPELQKHVERWKVSKGIREGIFLLEDDIKRGNVIIEKENGVIEAGIDVGLQKIEETMRG